ncbi:MAG: glycosyl hydrolase-related protein [Oscillospiraceae bacterium]|nr:glycosyl hydrolase-related protein [Oscillospiraceae bacterium]
MGKKYQMHVVSGTHWDREWRHTAEQSKLRLVDLMDNIINVLDTVPEYKCFCVDGGMIVLEDYLDIRPEKKEKLAELIKSGRMIVVNWYTLPETNTVAPESLIRNLLLGHRMSSEFGGGMKSGYTATSYGQHSQMPQLYQGFGIDTAIFYRGTNKHMPKLPLFKWEGSDGSTLDTLRTFDEVTRTNWFFYVHQPVVLGKPSKDLGYTYDRAHEPAHPADMGLYDKAFVALVEDFDFNHDPAVLKAAIKEAADQAMPYVIKDQLLALNMEDNDEPYKYLPKLISELNAVSDDIEFVQMSLDDYMDTIRDALPESEMHRHKGELRYTTSEIGAFNALLGATHSSRIKIKLFNEIVENNLINLAEPLAAVAWRLGKEYPRTNLDRAWSALLKNHAHDSICGAAVDLAHEDMMYNFSIAKTVAEEVVSRSMISIFSNLDTAKDFKDSDHVITLFNTQPFARKSVMPLVLDIPKAQKKSKSVDTGVGGTATGDLFYDIVDKDGNIIKYEELSREDVLIGIERELDTKAIKFPAKRLRLLIDAEVPAMGYASYALRIRPANIVHHPEIGSNRPLIARDGGTLENENIKVKINQNGTFSMLDKNTGHLMENMHYFTDSGEVGSAHVSVKPTRNHVVTSHGCQATITMMETNELRGVFKIELTLRVPGAATIDEGDRTREYKNIPITTKLSLEKGAKYLSINTKLRNEARDHKLWVNFPSGIKTDWAVSESAWDVAKRTVKHTINLDNAEQFFAFQPMQTFVDLSGENKGLAFMSKGLREYEIQDDENRTISITLLRTQRAYMTANANMNVEELDKHTGQHSFGDLEYNYALYPHSGDWRTGEVLTTAYDYKVDIKAVQGVSRAGSLPSAASFLKLDSDPGDIMVSAVKQAENGDGLIVRLWNSTEREINVTAESLLPVTSVSKLRMDESVKEADIAVDGGKFTVKAAPHKIVTLKLN